MNKIKKNMRYFRSLHKTFGRNIAFAWLYAYIAGKVADSSKTANRFYARKHKLIMEYLLDQNRDLIEKYKDSHVPSHSNAGNIWIFWWQGEENAPVVVRKSIEQLRKRAGGRTVVVVSRENYRTYAQIDGRILNKVKAGTLSVTHFSDLLRMKLLASHGGLWLDTGIFLTCNMPDWIFEKPFYSIKQVKSTSKKFVADDRWVIGVIGGCKGLPLFTFMADFLEKYWIENNMLIDYFLTDYGMSIAYGAVEEIKKAIDAVPVNNNCLYALGKIGADVFDEEKFRFLSKDTFFFRFLWREKYPVYSSDGRYTYYGVFADEKLC